jgi:hypothetical protein
MRIKSICVLIGAAVLILPSTRAGAVTQDDFLVRTTQNLIALCGAAPNDPLREKAIHFCHGYVVGAFHYYKATEASLGPAHIVCLPNPPPSRDEGIQNFVSWTNQNPQYMNEFPVETLFRFAATRWPCR